MDAGPCEKMVDVDADMQVKALLNAPVYGGSHQESIRRDGQHKGRQSLI